MQDANLLSLEPEDLFKPQDFLMVCKSKKCCKKYKKPGKKACGSCPKK